MLGWISENLQYLYCFIICFGPVGTDIIIWDGIKTTFDYVCSNIFVTGINMVENLQQNINNNDLFFLNLS